MAWRARPDRGIPPPRQEKPVRVHRPSGTVSPTQQKGPSDSTIWPTTWVDRAAPASGSPFHPIQFQVFDGEDRLGWEATAAQERPDPGRELGKRKRFYQVVIRSRVRALDTILHFAACGEDQDWRVGLLGTHLLQDRDTIQPRQIEIENDEVVVQLGGQGPRLLATSTA